ncbi:MAG: M1 family aminopeptidase, partial [Bacteroidota bacterium]
GYQSQGEKIKRGKESTYHFKSENVHDFMWAADRDYVHKTVQVPDGPLMHYFYVEDKITKETWPQLMEISPKMVGFMNKQFGKYPYSDFFVIQGGDGGMEYPMGTLIAGKGSIRGLVSVTMHEMFHSWYYGVLGFNESLYPWMDEGFTTYAQHLTKEFLYGTSNSPERWLKTYVSVTNSGAQEPLTTHSDHYHYNGVYGASAYNFGALVPYQLAYIMGQDTFDKAFRDLFYTWAFKHPEPEDFEFIMEKHADMVLDWFFIDWIGTTKHLDYAINSVKEEKGKTKVELINKNQRPMPVEVMVTYKDGTKERFYMPLRIMRGAKKFTDGIKTTQLSNWPWTHPINSFIIDTIPSNISKIEIDPDQGMVDIDYSNNSWVN